MRALVIMTVLAIGSTALAEATTQPGAKPVAMIEAEAMNLEKAQTKPIPGHDSAKAALLDAGDSRATTTIKLPEGKYHLIVYIYATDTGADAVFVDVDDTEYAVFAGETEKLVPHSRHTHFADEVEQIEIKSTGQPIKLTLRPKDLGAYVDRLEIYHAK